MAVRSRYLSFVSRLAAVLGCAATAPALAQGVAVQWKTSAGGNGHWYLFRPVATPIDWQQARASAESLGGHLATPTSAAENAFILGSVIAQGVAENDYGPHIGGFRDPKIPEPSAACANWHWTTGEPFDFLPDYGYDLCQSWANSVIEETRLHYWYGHTMIWNNCFGSLVSKYQLIEWSADCNNDGIVDFGQINDGSLADFDGDYVPDCCEAGTACTVGAYPVDWRAEVGGNGHWYQRRSFSGADVSFASGRALAEAIGGTLATPLSQSENDFIRDLNRFQYRSYWIGGVQVDPSCSGTGCEWSWVTAEPWAYTNWCCGVENDSGNEDCLAASEDGLWNSIACTGGPGLEHYMIEWSADCDGDGRVDFGEILRGEAADADANGVPDACEPYRVPAEFATIQAAIDAVAAGEHRVVLVAPGVYHESFELDGKDVLVLGAAGGTTILDGTGLATSIARFTGGEPATAGVARLVFRNGTAGSRLAQKSAFTVGGAIFGDTGSSASIRDCRFESNDADFGGAVYLYHGHAAIEGCVFAGNSATNDGGAVLLYECSGSVRLSEFTGNSCGAGGAGNGGAFKTVGARVAGGVFVLEDCVVSGTVSGVDGAAVHHFENAGLGVAGGLRVVNTTIAGNTSVIGAGGLRHDGSQGALVLAGSTSVCTNLVRNISGPFLLEGAAAVCDCLADVTGDGVVNGGDLGIVLNAWGGANALGTGDVNHDGVIDGTDLAGVLGSWGACP
jgi:Lectin C-type domain/Dockerin type I domain